MEIMDLINEKDEVIGTISRNEVKEKNILHRGSCVMVLNSKNEILITKRTNTKKIYPSLYEIGQGGGVDTKETYEEAAKRELFEEVGIKVPLNFIFKQRFKDEIVNNFACCYDCVYDGEIKFNEEEIVSYEWVSLEDIRKRIKESPEIFCPDSISLFEEYDRLKNGK